MIHNNEEKINLGQMAHILTPMIKGYVTGLQRDYTDMDSLNVMMLVEIARSNVSELDTEIARRLAALASARHAFAQEHSEAASKLAEPGPRSGSDLFKEALEGVGGDFKRLEGMDWPAHWSPQEREAFTDFKREVDAEFKRGQQASRPTPPTHPSANWGPATDGEWVPDGDYDRNTVTGHYERRGGHPAAVEYPEDLKQYFKDRDRLLEGAPTPPYKR